MRTALALNAYSLKFGGISKPRGRSCNEADTLRKDGWVGVRRPQGWIRRNG